MGDPRQGSVGAAGDLLHSLLSREPYRARWEPFRRRTAAADPVNQAAVAQVLALYLWESGQRPERQTALARLLKDRIHRALSGEVLSGETLTWFIEAFEMNADDAARLRATRSGSAPNPPVTGTLRGSQIVPLRQRHRTVAVFERRWIGADGRASAHRTTRAIMACEDGVESFPFRLRPAVKQVTRIHGGRLRATHTFEGSGPVLEIALNTPLRAGQVTSLDYQVAFEGDDLACEYRRVAHARTENVDIVVQFHPERRPLRLWWTVWDDYRGGHVLSEETVVLDREHRVHWFVPTMENAAAGFRWTW
ncbi:MULTISPECIES: hypothetical protein [Actinomadura]|uniref:Uncharacterized protein n=1 Tax=Actinomadura geliboluensis TaxID=882440 RepID=A0A5S4GSN9_9ACTN|nr:hypothetical protein [Actinomadura geliboluensis]TMR35849.1 hypothetical protein ETD96_22105 [Actinomadura geliboluensis]